MTTAPSDAAVQTALRCASFYRHIGWQPLPSRMDLKAPECPFSDYWDRKLPDSIYSPHKWRTTNIQVMTGTHWRLMVVDLDGEEAIGVWPRMVANYGDLPSTWICRTGSGGLHLYFTLPEWLDECPSRRVWGVWDTFAGVDPAKPGSPMKGDWQHHKEIRILGDNALVVAPPSIHVKTGKPYTFEVGPKDMPRPAEAPAWLIGLPEVTPPSSFTCPPMIHPAPARPLGGSPRGFYNRDDVLDAIPSKLAVAKAWGLRVASGSGGSKGWWTVHAIDRPDATPSCQFQEQSGLYWDGRDKTSIAFFDLGVKLGVFPNWKACQDSLGAEWLGT